tara:strand:+ start:23 stop:646 length:624 start_codon:yes stop_codon:yes gene_type:complete
MSRDIINIDSIRLTTELNKFRRNKSIPGSFLDGTFTILDLKDNYEDFSASHKKLADKLIDMYNVELRQSAEGLQKSLCNEYRGFLRNQFTRQEHWSFPAVMKKYRANINPVRAIYYDTKEMVKRFNHYDDHHGWLLSLVTDNEFHHRVMKDIIGDRKKVDKIINFYHPLFEAGKIPIPIEITHLKTLRSDLLDYANLFTKVKNWNPE